ncbi:MAG TPA: hypothetical protein VHI50_00125 [Micromonosporaceae bacterium]|jgi:hypothetical protein|nr:hypothetical protein [Micromonosporaceae bacterium]
MTAQRIAGWLGLAAHGAVFFWYAASGLVAPLWAVVALLAVWAALLAGAIWLWRTRPLLVPLVPVAAVLVWVAAVAAGDAFLDWTA